MDRTIATDRLILRPLVSSDARAIAEKINSYAISKNLARVPFPYTLEDADAFLSWAADLDYRSAFRAISLKQRPDDLIGVISYDWMEEKKLAELGYWLVEEQWGKGLMTEAARAMVQHAFLVSGHDLLSSCYFVENPASGKVLLHAGFEVTGTCKHFSKAQGREVPVINMQLSQENWRIKKAARK
jgi:RimJ/RimL family protein N-acetyltransferase